MHQVVRDETIQEASVVEVFNKALEHTRAWFRNALSRNLLEEYVGHVAFSICKEPEVCHQNKNVFYCTLTVYSLGLMVLCWRP